MAKFVTREYIEQKNRESEKYAKLVFETKSETVASGDNYEVLRLANGETVILYDDPQERVVWADDDTAWNRHYITVLKKGKIVCGHLAADAEEGETYEVYHYIRPFYERIKEAQ